MAAKKKSLLKKAPDLKSVLAELKQNGSAKFKADMSARYGIVTKAEVYGTTVAKLRAMAKKIGYDHALAEQLWATGIHDARMLACMVDDPAEVTPTQMERWVKGMDNWGLVDTACFHYWDRTPHAFAKIEKWSKSKDEFVKRAAFALLASCALHKQGTDAQFLRGLQLIEREASDPRNFVKKAANWALRAIGGKQSLKLRAAGRALAKRLADSDDPTERWNGKDALRAFARA
ncbi:DNA alkylation repair protein [Terricaulis sp.]|uniref:DNA alkylation repair protein n=1 Tax=Terricaulis sp. TaxID=2768686 RepID=UPI002AC51F75|nr:DNA alkylation repair protein [Terricaulis sp.]MDZ4692139.1 DNA alkylation repair protein [Terricaulis sp.]